MRALRAFATALAVITASSALADETVLTVRAGDSVHTLDMAAIDALPQVSFTTTSVWTEGAHEFSGPALATVLESLGVSGDVVHARAVNDYAVEIPMAEIEAGAPIIATRIDGQPFPRREKGPLWIVYPYDTDARFQTEIVYGRSIWQLVELQLD